MLADAIAVAQQRNERTLADALGKSLRSWTPYERALWAELPPVIRNAIERRERERDVALRRMQNQVAELRKRHGGAKPANIDIKEIAK
jgi:hypothetical protein